MIRFFGNVFAWVSLLAGAFDGLENLALIQLLLGSELTVWNGMSYCGALAKSSGLVVYLDEVDDSEADDEMTAMP